MHMICWGYEMKEIELRNAKKYLRIEQKEDEDYYYCPLCNNLILIVDKNKNWHIGSSCRHFDFWLISITEYSLRYFQLRKMSAITIFDDINVYLLVPKSR
jgi:hypothetical protein